MTTLWLRRRQVLLLALCVLLALFVVLVWRLLTTSTPPPRAPTRPPGHITPTNAPAYLFTIPSFPHGPLKVGAQVQVEWSPTLVFRHDSQLGPAPVVCTLTLYGPYASAESATLALQSAGYLTDEPAFVAPPLALNDGDASAHSVEIALPLTLLPGYYIADSRSERAVDNTVIGAGAVVEVVA